MKNLMLLFIFIKGRTGTLRYYVNESVTQSEYFDANVELKKIKCYTIFATNLFSHEQHYIMFLSEMKSLRL